MCKIGHVLIILSIITTAKTDDIPGCDYFDTVSLKGREHFENGSYLYNNILIPSDKIGTYDYRTTIYGAVKQVSSYPRGCLCQVKSCVLFCCEPDKLINNFGVNITLNNGQDVQVNVLNEFAVQVKFEMSCDLLEDNTIDKQTLGQWKLFENGTLFNLTDSSEVKKEDYCLIPLKVSDDYFELVPVSFEPEIQIKTTIDVHGAIKVISVLFMVITIGVYLYLPEFKTIYSKCCLCYFVCVTISFLLMWIESLIRDFVTSRLVCFMIGYCGYYAVMAVFLWLLVINFHLWKKFTNFDITDNINMIRYHIFVWTAAAVLLIITGSFEYKFLDMEDDEALLWQPGVGIYYCWMNTQNWSAMIFYYGPILLGIFINLTLSIITARHIFVENRKNNAVWNTAESQKNITNQTDLVMFLRIFSIAGVIWLLDIFSYLFEINIKCITFFSDIITSSQGIILFFTTIWEKEVIKSLYERMDANSSKSKTKFRSSSSGIKSSETTFISN